MHQCRYYIKIFNFHSLSNFLLDNVVVQCYIMWSLMTIWVHIVVNYNWIVQFQGYNWISLPIMIETHYIQQVVPYLNLKENYPYSCDIANNGTSLYNRTFIMGSYPVSNIGAINKLLITFHSIIYYSLYMDTNGVYSCTCYAIHFWQSRSIQATYGWI